MSADYDIDLGGALVFIMRAALLFVDGVVGGEVGSLRDVPALGSLAPASPSPS